jgi:hypothetical protein
MRSTPARRSAWVCISRSNADLDVNRLGAQELPRQDQPDIHALAMTYATVSLGGSELLGRFPSARPDPAGPAGITCLAASRQGLQA